MKTNELLKLMRVGESETIEFKKQIGGDINRVIVAMANSSGGHVVVGVDDDGALVGINVKTASDKLANSVQSIVPFPKISTHRFRIDGKDILVIAVARSDTLLSIGGVAYIRTGAGMRPLSIQEILTLAAETGSFEWDSTPYISRKEANRKYIEKYFDSINMARNKKILIKDKERYLRSIGAVKENKLTNAGILFFTEVSEYIHQAGIRLLYMEGEEAIWSKEYEGPVWKTLEEVFADIQKETNKREVIIATGRKRIEEYPMRVIREALINAVAHRNYTIPADIRVFLSRDCIKIKNPGGLMPGVRIDNPDHVPRNPALCNMLYDYGLIERYGRGIRMMREIVKTHPDMDLSFDTEGNQFTVELTKSRNFEMDEMDERILKVLTRPMKSGEISVLMSVSKPTILSHLKKLETIGYIKKQGRGPQIKYSQK